MYSQIVNRFLAVIMMGFVLLMVVAGPILMVFAGIVFVIALPALIGLILIYGLVLEIKDSLVRRSP